MEIVDGDARGSLNFNNIQQMLLKAGYAPLDSEIISFLRRIDRDDDGVISALELSRFLEQFNIARAMSIQ